MVKPSCNGLYDALDTLAFNYYSVVKPLLDAGGGGYFIHRHSRINAQLCL
ncbi:hypothetical protein ACY2P8_001450 [Campylobacter upsaliensis]